MSQGFTKGTPIDTDPTLSLNSDIVVPSQKAVKTYVASQIGTPVTTVNATSPILSSGGTTPNISMPAATGSINGYLTSSDWTNFNTAYTNRITSLTTTGSSGSATLISNVLNVPTYTLAGLGGQPQLNGTGFVVATGTVISYDNTAYAPLASPTFTGDPKAPTPAAGDNDTSIATTAFVNTAIQSTSPTVVLFRDYSPASLTGTLTNTLVWSTSVNANVFQTNDLLEIRSYFNSNAANGTTTNWRLYVNTSASLTGATQIGAYANGSGTGNGGYQRNIFITASGASGNFRTLPIAANVTNSYGVSSSAIANFTVNTTVTLYFIWAIQLGNTANTASIQGTIATITR